MRSIERELDYPTRLEERRDHQSRQVNLIDSIMQDSFSQEESSAA